MNFHRTWFLCVTLVVLFLLPGCAASQPQATPTLVPTVAIAPTATPTPTLAPTATATAAAYPYPLDEGVAQAGYPYPADGGAPAGAPAVDNRSRVQLTLIEQAPDAEDAGTTRLRVLVNAVEAIEGTNNLIAGLANTEADFYARTADVPELRPGDQFYAEVTLRGDEHGAKVFIVLFDR